MKKLAKFIGAAVILAGVIGIVQADGPAGPGEPSMAGPNPLLLALSHWG